MTKSYGNNVGNRKNLECIYKVTTPVPRCENSWQEDKARNTEEF